MKESKYDYWAIFVYVVDRTFIGFLASFILVVILIIALIIGMAYALSLFGFAGTMVLSATVAICVLVVGCVVEFKKRKNYYAKY